MTDEELKAIGERCMAATPGPWAQGDRWTPRTRCMYMVVADNSLPETLPQLEKDFSFMLNARTDIPALLAEVCRLRAQIAYLEGRPCIDPKDVYAALRDDVKPLFGS